MKKPDILFASEPVVEVFEKLGILYYIGGSVASSTYGIPRATMDIASLRCRYFLPYWKEERISRLSS
jgi:hypothetical protein